MLSIPARSLTAATMVLLAIAPIALTGCKPKGETPEQSRAEYYREDANPEQAAKGDPDASVDSKTMETSVDEDPRARGGDLDTISELPAGKKLSEYPAMFKKLGYAIVNQKRLREALVYEIKKPDEAYTVTLFAPRGSDVVEHIDTKHYRNMDAKNPYSEENPPNAIDKAAAPKKSANNLH